MQRFQNVFGKKKCIIIGMVHVMALPGTPKYSGNFQYNIEKVKYEANIYKKHKVDAVLLENMHDVPYIQNTYLGPEIIATMTRLSIEVKNILPKQTPCGIQILACGNNQAIAVAKAANLQFIRAEGYVFSHVADEGFTDANAGNMLRYRKQIDAENVLVLTDLKKKHSSHAITSDVTLLDTALAAEFFLTDGIVLSGTATGQEVSMDDLNMVSNRIKSPILIGSGVTSGNIHIYFDSCHGVIIGSHLKNNGQWQNELCEQRMYTFFEQVRELRNCKE